MYRRYGMQNQNNEIYEIVSFCNALPFLLDLVRHG